MTPFLFPYPFTINSNSDLYLYLQTKVKMALCPTLSIWLRHTLFAIAMVAIIINITKKRSGRLTIKIKHYKIAQNCPQTELS